MSEQGVKSGQPGRQAPTAPKQGSVTLRAVTPEDAPLCLMSVLAIDAAKCSSGN